MSDNLHNLPMPDPAQEISEEEVDTMARMLAAQELAKERAHKIVKERRKEDSQPTTKRLGKSLANAFKSAGDWVSEKTDELEAKKEEREVEKIARELAREELVESKKDEARRVLAQRKAEEKEEEAAS